MFNLAMFYTSASIIILPLSCISACHPKYFVNYKTNKNYCKGSCQIVVKIYKYIYMYKLEYKTILTSIISLCKQRLVVLLQQRQRSCTDVGNDNLCGYPSTQNIIMRPAKWIRPNSNRKLF